MWKIETNLGQKWPTPNKWKESEGEEERKRRKTMVTNS